MKKILRNRKGFTLIELMIVLAIIFILIFTVLLPLISGLFGSSSDSEIEVITKQKPSVEIQQPSEDKIKKDIENNKETGFKKL
jgi:prepilin-type N-terminal cleavage/methylation domain-containing protein